MNMHIKGKWTTLIFLLACFVVFILQRNTICHEGSCPCFVCLDKYFADCILDSSLPHYGHLPLNRSLYVGGVTSTSLHIIAPVTT